ncbi:hypothetical protein J2T22_001250 [Pseudarthrobacter defluvii]|uniref:O-antigen ligase-like membrane protein n=1 Tax=Pseudarthrobacter defluvii TaxID=410837 RepID=A0ABT9UGH6_9MICC|nr:hypothetical protein [Pseudarthrobacter defluvii]MDQ0118073.1 hypothetical protein [Pseudarthrobacter defluvii]
MPLNFPVASAAVNRGDDRYSLRTAALLGFFAIAAQRFTLGATGVQITTVVMFAAAGVLIVKAKNGLNAINVLLTAALVLAAYLSTLLAPVATSVTSLLLLVGSYILIILRGASEPSLHLGQQFFAGAVTGIKMGGLLGIAQYFVQKMGSGFFDPLLLVSKQWLVAGFNSYYDLEYSGGQKGEYKPNGIIFLEPSFLSLYCAIGLVFIVGKIFQPDPDGKAIQTRTRERRRNAVWAIVLVAAIAVSASTSGLVVLGVALLPLLFTVKRNRLMLLTAGLLTAVGAGMGFFSDLIAKANEGFTGNTSTALRLTLPYELLSPYWLERPLIGWGPGSASEAIRNVGVPGLQATTIMKVLIEYGLLGALVVALIAFAALSTSRAPLALRAAVFAAWLIPSDNLLNSTLVLLMLVALPNWGPSTAIIQSRTATD